MIKCADKRWIDRPSGRFNGIKQLSYSFCLLIVSLSMILSCSRNSENRDQDAVLAKVGEKTITVQDFLHRSEYAIRPPYCRADNKIHKKIILNSLIGEKLLALEAGDVNELTSDENYQAYLEGRKEQAMRQIHYFEEAHKKIELDPDEIQNEYKIAGRKYQISYFTLKDKSLADRIANQFSDEKIGFIEMYHSLTGDSLVPQREVSWEKSENQNIFDALFRKNVEKGGIVGPLNIQDEQILFIKVDGWVDSQVMTEQAVRERRSKVVEKLTDEKAWASYQVDIGNLMRNKEMQFYESTFKRLVTLTAPFYIQSDESKQRLFNNSFWQNSEDDVDLSHVLQDLDDINHFPLFSIDGKVWTIERFRAKLKRHPLVFRKNDLQNKNFAEQFKLAIVDMVRDNYITQDAYQKGYDQSRIVQRQITMWRDHLSALYQKYTFLKSIEIKESDQIKIVDSYMTPYIDSLQVCYHQDIEIDLKLLDEIQLTQIDMIVLQPDQPFPIVAPAFPLVTSDHHIDYGKAM